MEDINKDEIKCKWCGSTHIIKHQSVNTVKKGMRKRYKCHDCAHTFYDDKDGGANG